MYPTSPQSPGHLIQSPKVQNLIKKLPKANSLHLKFEGNNALEYIELRKLGLLSKRIFPHLQAFNLEYQGTRTLRNHHLVKISKHMNGKMRKLKHLSVKFWFFRGLLVDMRPLLKEIKHDFGGLVTLDLSFKMVFGLTKEVLWNFERLFGRMGATLKNLSLDFSGNRNSVVNFAEGIGEIIMRNLAKLERLCLNFERTWLSTRVVRLLINGTCSHLRDLRSLVMKVGSCYVAKEELKDYQKSLTSNLQFLKVDFYGSFDLSIQYLSILQNDIVRLCPNLEELYLRTLNCKRFSNEFYMAMEREFLGRLNLKRFRLLYSNEQQYVWNIYQDKEIMEFDKAKEIEEEVWKIKEKARGEDEVKIYFETVEEESAGEGSELDEQDYLRYQLERELLEMEKREIEEQEMVTEEFVEEDPLYLTYDPGVEEGEDENENENDDLKEIYGRMEEEEAAQDIAEAEIRGFGIGGNYYRQGLINDL